MRHRPSSPRGPLWDTLELLGFLVLLCAAAFILWLWGEVAMLWEAKAAAYLIAFFGLLGLFLLSIAHILRLFRKARREWRQTFPPRATRDARRPQRRRGPPLL